MNRLKSFANLTHLDACAPELQLAVHTVAAHKSRSFELFNTQQYERWADALRGADASVCAQQHRETKLSMIAMQRAPANKSH